MNKELLDKILSLENFIIEKQTLVDNTEIYIRPLYIELISLYPKLQKELAKEISVQISESSPEVIYAVEASILPVASLVSQELNIPLSVIRKPRNYKHENDEPQLYISNELKNKVSVLLDDAIWSGYTMRYIFELFRKQEIRMPQFYFLFDFMDFIKGGTYLDRHELAILGERRSWVTYRECVERAYIMGIISNETYKNTLNLFDIVD